MLNGIRNGGRIALLACALLVAACSPSATEAPEPKTEFNIGWSIYAGWMPWPYAQQAGIVKKWADKYGVEINFVQVNDYVESVNQYTAGKLDGVTVANMDALTIPAAGGKDTSAIIVGDYSNGNDGILLKGAGSLAAIKGRQVNLVELSVSHYLLARAARIDQDAADRREDGEHRRRGHRRRLRRPRRHRGGRVEPAAFGDEGHAGRQAGVQLRRHPGRDPRPAGGRYRDAQGQSRTSARRWLASGTRPWR